MAHSTNILLITLICLAISSVSSAIKIEKIEGVDLLHNSKISIATQASGKKGTVVIFLSAKCPCSNSHVTQLKELANKFDEFRFVAVHANLDESKAVSKEYFEAARFPFEVIQDEGQALANLLNANKTPHAFLIDSTGDIVYRGGVTESSNGEQAKKFYLKQAIEELRSGKKVSQPEERTLGCIIQRPSEMNVW